MSTVMRLAHSVLNRFPTLKRWLKRFLSRAYGSSNVSIGYVSIQPAEIDLQASKLRGAWQAQALPDRQRKLVDRQLAEYRRGVNVQVFDVLVDAMKYAIVSAAARSTRDVAARTVLEVGCSSGYYSEVFEVAKLGVSYTGVDYSEAFVEMARRIYPEVTFDVGDATALRYADEAFDVVVSGCCLLHIPDYESAVAEAARIARRYAIFHRTPVVLDQPNRYFRKLAYGVETVEIHFNEPQFLDLLRSHGMELMRTWTLSEDPTGAVRTYLCRVV